MNNFSKTISFIFLATVFFGGCNFSLKQNNTELKLQNDTSVRNSVEQDSVAVEEEIKTDIEMEEQENTKDKQKEAENKEQNETEIVREDKEIKNESKITDKIVDWGFAVSKNRTIDTIIIHSSYNAIGSDLHNLDDIIYKEYKPYGVSPHYIISREGKIFRLVSDKNIAYHAGESEVPDGRTGVNNFSIGIEIVNTKSEKPSDAQYSALENLLMYLKEKYEIKYVLGHSDIAPGRKDDPWNFDWNQL